MGGAGNETLNNDAYQQQLRAGQAASANLWNQSGSNTFDPFGGPVAPSGVRSAASDSAKQGYQQRLGAYQQNKQSWDQQQNILNSVLNSPSLYNPIQYTPYNNQGAQQTNPFVAQPGDAPLTIDNMLNQQPQSGARSRLSPGTQGPRSFSQGNWDKRAQGGARSQSDQYSDVAWDLIGRRQGLQAGLSPQGQPRQPRK